MPQVDLETLVSVCGGGGGGGGSNDRKIACETLADGDHPPVGPDLEEIPPDFPPESFWLSKDAEYDWFDRNAFLERKESTKGNNNNNNSNNNNNHSTTTNSNSSSQRFSMNLKSKASIIGLPKPQKTCFADTKLRRNHIKPANIQLFPKRPQPANKSSVQFSEPSSPKVSCMGRVRSKRDRSRRLRNRQQLSEPATEIPKPERRRKPGVWSSLRAIFGTGCRHKPRVQMNEPRTESTPRNSASTKARVRNDDPPSESPPRRSVTARARDGSPIEPVAEAPGLGGMNRFASGRRSASWAVDEMVNADVTKS